MHETDGGGLTEDHLPAVEHAKLIKRENRRRQKTTKGPRKGSHDNVERQSKGKLGATVPPRHVVRDPGKHTRLKDAQHKTDAADLRGVIDERCED